MMASTSPLELFAVGRNKEALARLQVIEGSRELNVGEQVLRSELLCARADYESAATVASQLLRRDDLSDIQRCKLRFVLGQHSFNRGNADKGTEHFRVGAEIAAHSGNTKEECRLRVELFRHEIKGLGVHQASADIETLRRQVHKTGSASVALLFQIGLIELTLKLSLQSHARKHLETARALLPQVSNLKLHAQFRHTEVIVALEEGDTGEALRLGLALANDDSLDALTVNLQGLIGHVLMMRGDYLEAERWTQRILGTAEKDGGREVAALDSMMFLRLSQGDLRGAGEYKTIIHRVLSRNPGLQNSTYGLWHLPTLVRWLYGLGQFDDGVSELRNATTRIAGLGDRRLLARTKLLEAEGLGRTGRSEEGAVLVNEVLASTPQVPLEILAEASRVMGGLLSEDQPSRALAYFRRAEQTLALLGHNAFLTAAQEDRRRSIRDDQPQSTSKHETIASLVERIAAILCVGGHPLVLAAQAQELFADAGVAHSVTLARKDAQPPLPDETTVRVPLGAHRNSYYELQIDPPRHAADHATLSSITRIVRKSIELANARAAERERALWSAPSSGQHSGLICSSERMLELVKTVQRVATSEASVILTGETGVGKEVFATALHRASHRNGKTFLPFNCSTVPREMIDSQLFGHKRGSFTGATNDSAGVIRAAAGGTLFLDEIGEMPLESQPKLLRFLESGEILPLGETRPIHVDVRVVAATNANLDQLVADGRFREDLFYRLNVIRINIPPLRERREEIPALVEHFLEQFGRELQKPLLRVADETLEYLVLYHWPGNVRQLANEVRRLVAMAEPGTVIMPAHLINDIFESRRTLPANRSPRLFDEVVTRIDQPLSAAVEHIERAAIQRALAMTDGHLDEAARILGLSRKGLYLKRQRLNLG